MLIGLFGTGRNGSSLIGRLLDGLQDAYVHPVEEIFLSKFDDLARLGEVRRLTAQNCVTHPLTHLAHALPGGVLATAFRGSADTLYDTYMQQCESTRSAPRPSLARILGERSYDARAFVLHYLSSMGAAVRADLARPHQLFKSVETPYIPTFAAMFPDMKFVHILRHPIAVCSSQKRSLMENKRQPASYLGYDWLSCMLDKRWIPHARVVTAHPNDPRHVTVLYEDLVANPDAEIRRVARELNLGAPARPSRQTIFGDEDMSSWGFNPSKAGAETPVEVVADLQAKLQYDEILSKREIDLINLKTRALQEALGYVPTTRPSRASVAAQYAIVDRSEWANVRGARGWARALHGMVYRRLALFG